MGGLHEAYVEEVGRVEPRSRGGVQSGCTRRREKDPGLVQGLGNVHRGEHGPRGLAGLPQLPRGRRHSLRLVLHRRTRPGKGLNSRLPDRHRAHLCNLYTVCTHLVHNFYRVTYIWNKQQQQQLEKLTTKIAKYPPQKPKKKEFKLYWKLWFRSNRAFVPRLADPETHRDGTRDGKGAFPRFCVSFPNRTLSESDTFAVCQVSSGTPRF